MKPSILSLIPFLTAALVFSPPVRADDTLSYNRSSSIEALHPDWMRWVPDSKQLSDLSLPGTHDTMALYGGDLVETQSLTLRRQLNAGIRVVDIRCRHIDNVFTIHHGVVFQNAYFGNDVLKVCYEFLQDNPTETILMRVGDAGVPDEKDCTRDYKETFEWYRDSTTYGSCIFVDPNDYDTIAPLGAVRGKVVILDEFSGGRYGYNLFGSNNDTLDMQAEYDLNTLFDCDNKWFIVRDFLRYTDGDAPTFTEWGDGGTTLSGRTHQRPAESGRFYINWLSATSFNGGVYPNAIARYVHPRVLQYLFGRNQNRTTGFVWMDFPGAGLIDAVIAHNLKYATNASDRAVFRSSFRNIFDGTCYALKDAAFDDYSLTQRATELQNWLRHILPARGSVLDYWSVVAKEGDQGDANWAVVSGERSGHSLITQSDLIDGRSYIALNAASQTGSVTAAQLSSYLIGSGPVTLQSSITGTVNAAGNCLGRARTLQNLVSARFPHVRWNVAVSRNAGLGMAWDTLASCLASAPSGSDLYFYYVWAGSENDTAPVPSAGGPYTVNEGTPAVFDASATTNLDNQALTYRWDFDNNGTWDVVTSANTASRLFSNQGTYTVRLQVFDDGNTVETTTSVTVNNVAPVLNLGAPAADVLTGESFSRSCFFTDPGSDTWTVTVNYGDGSPPQNISPLNKAFTLGHTYATADTRTVTVTVNDGSVSAQGIISVKAITPGPPIVKSFNGPNGPVPEGSTVTVNGSFYYAGWSQTLSIAWGDGSPDTQASVVNASGGNYAFTAQHTYANLPPGGAAQYTVTATWPAWTTRTLPVTVVDVPPAFSSLTFPATVPEGTLVQVGYTITAPTQDVLIKKVNWGDGASQNWTGGPLTSTSPAHTYTTAGNYLMTISVTDEDQSTDVETRTITVTDAAPTIFDFIHVSANVPEGGTASVLGHFQSTNLANDQFTVEIDWGDGRSSSTVSYQSVGANTAEFSTTHVYRDNNGTNPWTATVKVTDDDGSVATKTLAIPVGNLPPVVDAVPNFDIPSNTALTRSGNITDPGSDTFTGTVNYGDGTGTQALSITGNSYQLSHTYTANNVYTITVNVTDDDGTTASRSMKLLVGPVRDLLVINTNDSGAGSLRQAVLTANTASGASTEFPSAFADIKFAPALSGQTITLTSGQLASSLRTRIDASSLAAGVKVSGNGTSRILLVAVNNSVVLDSIHFTGGTTPLGGGAIMADSGAGLSLNRCAISNCTTTDRGGGIFFAKGTALTVNQSTVSGCTARSGGGIFFNGTKFSVSHCTFAGNTAAGISTSSGGALFNEAGPAVMNHCTVVSNTATGSSSKGGGVHSANAATLELNHSIVATNTAESLANISGPNSGEGNLTSGDPVLYPLGNYGGLTPTVPPRPGSPAIDAISSIQVPVSTTPLAFWHLGEGDPVAANGLTATASANEFGPDLAFAGPVTWSSAVSPTAAGWLDSRLGVTLASGGNGTSALVADFLGNTGITDNFGIELWVKPNTLTGTRCIAYNGHSGTSGWGLYQFDGSYGVLFGGVTIFGSGPAMAGTWTHLALVRNNGTATLYVNGVASGASTAVPNIPAGRFALGVQPQTLAAEFFVGSLDELRVFTFNPGEFSPNSLSYRPVTPAGVSYLPGTDGAAYSVSWSSDQRGYPRVSGTGADVGAVEVEQAPVRLTDDVGTATLRQTVADISPAGIIGFAPALTGKTVTLGSEIVIPKVLAIDGSSLAAGVTIDGGAGVNRVFSVNTGQTAALIALTLTGGNGGGTDMAQHGGALFNRGALTLRRCTFTGNTASAGGVLFNDSAGSVVVDQCTLSGNSATAEAGAIYHRGVSMLLHHCTVSGNQAPAFGGIYNDDSIPLTLTNTILAGNTGNNGADLHNRGPLTRTGANILTSYVQFGPGSSTGPAALTGAPLLAPPGSYGGPVPTMALKPGSPARNAAIGSTITSDQRGFPINGTPDIGAYEAGTFGGYDAWSYEFFGTTVPFGSDSEPDGASNGLEYALGLNPLGNDSGNATATAGAGIQFHYLPFATDLRYLVQQSTNLTQWSTVYAYDTSTGLITETGVTGTEDAVTGFITITPNHAVPRLFWRISVERMP